MATKEPTSNQTHPAPASGAALHLLLNAKQAAQALGISPRKLWSLTAGDQIPHVRIDRSVRYSPQALQNWIEEHSCAV
ncbi:MAG: helix-turn-helix domain-containing protein [Pirellulales bacterium]|nr:helix-turn-helix domain-containing protein [Pirellulales bacterium]